MAVKLLDVYCIYFKQFIRIYIFKKCSKRPNELRDLQGMLQIFENEISFCQIS